MRSRNCFGNAKIQNLDIYIRKCPLNNYIFRLYITVDGVFVGIPKCLKKWFNYGQSLFKCEWGCFVFTLFEKSSQGLPLEILHGKVLAAFPFVKIIYTNNVRMKKLQTKQNFVFKSLTGFRMGYKVRMDDFKSNKMVIQAGIFNKVDYAHTAAAEFFFYYISAGNGITGTKAYCLFLVNPCFFVFRY